MFNPPPRLALRIPPPCSRISTFFLRNLPPPMSHLQDTPTFRRPISRRPPLPQRPTLGIPTIPNIPSQRFLNLPIPLSNGTSTPTSRIPPSPTRPISKILPHTPPAKTRRSSSNLALALISAKCALGPPLQLPEWWAEAQGKDAWSSDLRGLAQRF